MGFQTRRYKISFIWSEKWLFKNLNSKNTLFSKIMSNFCRRYTILANNIPKNPSPHSGPLWPRIQIISFYAFDHGYVEKFGWLLATYVCSWSHQPLSSYSWNFGSHFKYYLSFTPYRSNQIQDVILKCQIGSSLFCQPGFWLLHGRNSRLWYLRLS